MGKPNQDSTQHLRDIRVGGGVIMTVWVLGKDWGMPPGVLAAVFGIITPDWLEAMGADWGIWPILLDGRAMKVWLGTDGGDRITS